MSPERLTAMDASPPCEDPQDEGTLGEWAEVEWIGVGELARGAADPFSEVEGAIIVARANREEEQAG